MWFWQSAERANSENMIELAREPCLVTTFWYMWPSKTIGWSQINLKYMFAMWLDTYTMWYFQTIKHPQKKHLDFVWQNELKKTWQNHQNHHRRNNSSYAWRGFVKVPPHKRPWYHPYRATDPQRRCPTCQTHHQRNRGHRNLHQGLMDHGRFWRTFGGIFLLSEWDMGVSKNRGTPKWMVIMETPIKMDDLGVPLFSEASIYKICSN